jgi:hypothetical protein
MFISTDGGDNSSPLIGDWSGTVGGVASSEGSEFLFGQVSGLGFGVVIFTDDHTSPEATSPTRLHLQKTTIHELGHLLGTGRADDDEWVVLPDEVYSGSGDDPTNEGIGYTGPDRYEWSVMSSGWNDPIDYTPMQGDYVAFSIEELSTINFNNIDTKDQ